VYQTNKTLFLNKNRKFCSRCHPVNWK